MTLPRESLAALCFGMTALFVPTHADAQRPTALPPATGQVPGPPSAWNGRARIAQINARMVERWVSSLSSQTPDGDREEFDYIVSDVDREEFDGVMLDEEWLTMPGKPDAPEPPSEDLDRLLKEPLVLDGVLVEEFTGNERALAKRGAVPRCSDNGKPIIVYHRSLREHFPSGAVLFLRYHELGHIALRHAVCSGKRPTYPPPQQGREKAADCYAVARLRQAFADPRDYIVAASTLLYYINRGDAQDGTRARARMLNTNGCPG
jgi:hypothetical protein